MPQNIRTGGVTAGLRFPELVDVDPRDFAANPAPVLKALMTYPAFRLALAQNQQAQGVADEQIFELGTKKATRTQRRTTDVNKATADAAASDYTLQDLPKKRKIDEMALDTEVDNLSLTRDAALLEAEGRLRKAEADRAKAMQDEALRPTDEEAKAMQDEDRARKADLDEATKALRDAQAAYQSARAATEPTRAAAVTTTANAAETRANKPDKRKVITSKEVDIGGVKKVVVVYQDPDSTEPSMEIVDLPEGARFDRAMTPAEAAAQMFAPKPAATPVTPPAPAPSPTPAPAAAKPSSLPTITTDEEYYGLEIGDKFIGPDGVKRTRVLSEKEKAAIKAARGQ